MDKNLLLAGLVILAMLMGCMHVINDYLGLHDDNAIEEGIEKLIELKTGLDIDLTP